MSIIGNSIILNSSQSQFDGQEVLVSCQHLTNGETNIQKKFYDSNKFSANFNSIGNLTITNNNYPNLNCYIYIYNYASYGVFTSGSSRIVYPFDGTLTLRQKTTSGITTLLTYSYNETGGKKANKDNVNFNLNDYLTLDFTTYSYPINRTFVFSYGIIISKRIIE